MIKEGKLICDRCGTMKGDVFEHPAVRGALCSRFTIALQDHFEDKTVRKDLCSACFKEISTAVEKA